MVSLTLTPFAPWHAAQTVAALALPASISAACANGATARTTDNPRIFFMGLLLCTRTQGYTSNPARTIVRRPLSGSHLRAMVCEVVVVVAAEVDHRRGRPGLAGPQLDDARGQGRYELAVVRNEDERPRVLVERGVERLDRLHVEVVGRLIEQHDVGHAEHELADQHALPLAAGDHLERFLLVVAREEELPERRAHDLVVLLAILAPPAAHPLRERLLALEFVRRILRPVARVRLLRPLDRAGAGFQVPRDAAQERGLADSVGADNRHLLARLDREIQLLEEVPAFLVALREALRLHGEPVELFLRVDEKADERVLPT